MTYEWIKQFYKAGLYSKGDLAFFVQAGFLTEAQKEAIAGGS